MEAIMMFKKTREEIENTKKILTELQNRKKQQLEEVRRVIQERVVALPINEAKKWLGDLYWTDKELAGPIGKAYLEVFGGRFVAPPRSMEVACVRCGWKEHTDRASWTNCQQHFVCQECVEQDRLATELRLSKWRAQEKQKSELLAELQSMPYQDYLKTEHWREFRKYALKRVGYRCQLCNKNGKLHVHHRTYERRGCEEIGDVTVLCENCHGKHHDVLPTNH